MPVTWRPPEVFLIHSGVTIYHAYKDDWSDTPLQYWYSTCRDSCADSEFEFDVRDLPTAGEPTLRDHDTVIRAAIDAGLLVQDEPPTF